MNQIVVIEEAKRLHPDRPIDAIKHIRLTLNCGLKEAHDLYKGIQVPSEQPYPLVLEQFRANTAKAKVGNSAYLIFRQLWRISSTSSSTRIPHERTGLTF